MGQCRARNYGDTPYTCCLGDEGHDGDHSDWRANEWREGDDRPHFPRVRRAMRFIVEADAGDRDEKEIARIRSECEVALRLVLRRHGIDHTVDRRRVVGQFD